jgi:hypothetical protein
MILGNKTMPQSLLISHKQIDSNLEDLLLRLSSFKKEIDKNSLLKLTNLLVRYLRAVKNKHFLVEEIELFPSANLNSNDLERLLKDHQEIYSKLDLLADNLKKFNQELDAQTLQEKILFPAYNLISTIRHHAQREDLMLSYKLRQL